jgi:hypothetical protein
MPYKHEGDIVLLCRQWYSVNRVQFWTLASEDAGINLPRDNWRLGIILGAIWKQIAKLDEKAAECNLEEEKRAFCERTIAMNL